MNFIEAIKTGLPLTRKDKNWYYKHNINRYVNITPNTFIELNFFLEYIIFYAEDILADDWIVKNDLMNDENWETIKTEYKNEYKI